MTALPRLAPHLATVLILLATGGCQYFQAEEPITASSAADVAACRKRADQIFELQNRGAVYADDIYHTNDRDSPYATTGLTGITSSGLGASYQRDQFEQSCLRSTNSSAPTVVTPPAGPSQSPKPPVP